MPLLAIDYRLGITHLTVHHGKLVAFVHEPHLHGVSANHVKPRSPALSTKMASSGSGLRHAAASTDDGMLRREKSLRYQRGLAATIAGQYLTRLPAD
jgi:hypothetical protein